MISIFTTLYFLNGPEGPFSPAGGFSNCCEAPLKLQGQARTHNANYSRTRAQFGVLLRNTPHIGGCRPLLLAQFTPALGLQPALGWGH